MAKIATIRVAPLLLVGCSVDAGLNWRAGHAAGRTRRRGRDRSRGRGTGRARSPSTSSADRQRAH